ncbi:MAG TPA: hypothetical protein VGR02_15165 [Thermoanaerobaculia bacterium]|jgi:hypothetical protein|nr:hypothetical protein [Thermoanaerobaculia bacterium]
MLTLNADHAFRLQWEPDQNAEGAAIARRFLAGERELMRLDGSLAAGARDLHQFLEATGDALVVSRAASGEILIAPEGDGPTLLLSGKTADVLRAYLDDRPVRMQDRFDMTQRLRRNMV